MSMPLDIEDLSHLLERIKSARIAVIGDFCLDAYWFADLSRCETSIETGLPTHPIARQRYSLGGAGNVAANLSALGVGTLHALGVVGDDPWGRELLRLLTRSGAQTAGVLTQTEQWDTLAYVKPHVEGREESRRDFGNFNEISDETVRKLISHLDDLAPELDLVVINQQVLQGIHARALRALLAEIIEHYPGLFFIADSRHFSDSFPGALVKLNAHEAARQAGFAQDRARPVPREDALASAERLYQRFRRPVFVSRGAQGVAVRSSAGLAEIPGVVVTGEIDAVGAGDSMLAGISAALATGGSPQQAACLGNLAAAVTISKLYETGAASPDEILTIARCAEYRPLA